MYCYGLVNKLSPEDTVVRQCHFFNIYAMNNPRYINIVFIIDIIIIKV